MAVEFDLDLEGLDEDALERGGSVPAGWYHAAVEDVYEDHKNEGVTVIKFKVVDGEYHDYTIFDRLYDPGLASDTDKAETSRRRLALYCKRLGLLQAGDFGQHKHVNLADAIGRECYLLLKDRTYTDRNGDKKTATNVDFGGIFPPGHEKLPPELGGKPKTPRTPAKAGTAAATTPRRRQSEDYGKLI